MFDVFGPVKDFLSLDKICIDNNIFRLHYKATVIVLITCSLLVTSRQYIGDPIDCIVDPDVPQNVMDTYCWIHSTFSIPNRYEGRNEVGKDVPHPNVRPEQEGDERVYHKYYQWVCFALFFSSNCLLCSKIPLESVRVWPSAHAGPGHECTNGEAG